jgi:hypothetical protein
MFYRICSLCTDYVTESLYNVEKLDAMLDGVPVPIA